MRSLRRLRILVVDDEPLIGAAITRMLAGHEVVALTSARAAFGHLAAGERFDAILCDLMMPDLSGMELYRAVQSAVPELLDRLVFITGGAYTPESMSFLAAVANRHLEKPIEPAALYRVVADFGDATAAADIPAES